MGERSPHNDVTAKGAFIGLSVTTSGERSKAVMKGAVFARKDCRKAAQGGKAGPKNTKLCGGGRSQVWGRILSKVRSLTGKKFETGPSPAGGKRIFAVAGCGAYETLGSAAGRIVRGKEAIEPNAGTGARV